MSRTQRYIVVIILIGLCYLFISYMPYGNHVPLKKNLSYFPFKIDEWTGRDVGFQEDLPPYTDQDILRKYVDRDGVSLSVYVGYWGKFNLKTNVFSGAHLSPGFMWDPVTEKKIFIEVDGKRISLSEIIFTKGQRTTSVIYWYQTDRGTVNGRFRGRVFNGIDAILNNDTHVALIKIVAQQYENKNPDDIKSKQRELATLIFPLLTEYLPFNGA